MNAPVLRLPGLLVASAVGVLLGACGSGLYDASGVPLLEQRGQLCDVATQVSCGGVCTPEDASHCGAACVDCTAGDPPPAGAVAACVVASGAGAGSGTCGYECTDGLMRCTTGCCAAIGVAAGERFTCALAADGAVACWGANDAGQLGDGTDSARAVPGTVALPSAATAVGAGVRHACAVIAGGEVRCWGANEEGQVTGTATGSPALTAAATPVTTGAVAVVAGASHTCARLSSGAVRCWGAAAQSGGDVAVGAGATDIAAGRNHTCALVAGAVRCWGANAAGQLGDGTTTSPIETVAAALAGPQQLVGAGGDQTCAATGASSGDAVDDAIRCWGDSLGDVGAGFGFASPQLTPAIPLKDAGQSTIRNEVGLLAVGRKHVCVRDRGEAIECFGANDQGQLGGTPVGAGEAVTVPLPAAPPAAIATAIAAGADHTCAVLNGGRLRCWGANDSGQLGGGTTATPATGSIVTPLGR